MKVYLYVDGAARGNPGPAGIGVVIKNEANEVLLEVADYVGKTTNNVAEYMALIRGLEEVIDMGHRSVEAYSDSELMVKQINGEYRVKNEGLLPLYLHLKSLIRKFTHFSINHTVRDGNQHADDLANKGIDGQATKGMPLFSAP